jgi:hypothetical protein
MRRGRVSGGCHGVNRARTGDDPVIEPAPQPTEDQIRERAYEISQRADGGTAEENWKRARSELLDELAAAGDGSGRPSGEN